MAWSWSHTVEAYCNARENVFRLDREDLEIIYSEWKACPDPDVDCNEFDEESYNRALQYARNLPDDVLAEYIWEQSENLATCDNGGFNAWVCPSGCHTVSFDCDIPHEERISVY